jgi:hypothetical protein
VRALVVERSFGGGNSHRVVGDPGIAETRVNAPAAFDGKRRGHRHQRKVALAPTGLR